MSRSPRIISCPVCDALAADPCKDLPDQAYHFARVEEFDGGGDPVFLDTYQRGNRDGLLGFALWAERQADVCEASAEKIANLDRLGFGQRVAASKLLASRYSGARAWREAARMARRFSEALPIDPQQEPET